jgi:hypothetical protein
MKKYFSVLALFILQTSVCFGLTTQERRSLQNITKWAIEQQAQLQSAQTNIIKLSEENIVLTQEAKKKDDMISWQNTQISNLEIWGNRCEQAVKAIAMALAVAVAISIGTAFAGEILKNFPSFEGPVAAVILYFVVFLATYYFVMACIFAVAPYVPSIPVWHDLQSWVTHIHAPKI